MQIDISDIIADPRTQPRVQMDMFVIDEYAEAMRNGAHFPPIVVFHNGDGEGYYLADGFHRYHAAKRAHIATLEADVHHGGLDDAIWHSYGANQEHGLRRTNKDKRRAVEAALRHPFAARYSDEHIAHHCGVHRNTVLAYRNHLAQIVQDTAERTVTRNGTTYTMTVANIGKPSPSERITDDARDILRNTLFADDPHNLKRISGMEPEQQIAIAEQVAKHGFTNVQKAWSALNRSENEERAANLPDIGERYQLYHCAIADLRKHIAPKTVDVVITDPPYPREYLNVYAELSDLCAYALKDGGLLVAMVGKEHLPAYITGLSARLQYHWLAPFMMTENAKVWDRHVYTSWKPLLIFSNGPYTGPFFHDVIASHIPPDKTLHEWEQSFEGMQIIVERFSRPADVILDPFCGAGTTGTAALSQNRVFIGADIEASAIEKTRGQIAKYLEQQ